MDNFLKLSAKVFFFFFFFIFQGIWQSSFAVAVDSVGGIVVTDYFESTFHVLDKEGNLASSYRPSDNIVRAFGVVIDCMNNILIAEKTSLSIFG